MEQRVAAPDRIFTTFGYVWFLVIIWYNYHVVQDWYRYLFYFFLYFWEFLSYCKIFKVFSTTLEPYVTFSFQWTPEQNLGKYSPRLWSNSRKPDRSQEISKMEHEYQTCRVGTGRYWEVVSFATITFANLVLFSCDTVHKYFFFEQAPLSEEEKFFPLAYGLIVYHDIVQVWMLKSTVATRPIRSWKGLPRNTVHSVVREIFDFLFLRSFYK